MGVGAAIAAAGVLGAGASVISGSKAAGAATQAANIQAQAADRAADVTQGMYTQTRNDLIPFQNVGRGTIPYLNSLIPGGFQFPTQNGQGGAGALSPSTSAQNPAVSSSPLPGYQMAGVDEAGNPVYMNPNMAGGGDSGFATSGGLQAPGADGGPVQSAAGAGSSPFLTNFAAQLPGSGSPVQNSLNGLVPGSSTPGATAQNLNTFIYGSGSPVANQAMIDLQSFNPSKAGTSEGNSSLNMVNNLLGFGGPNGGGFDAAQMQAALEQTPGYQFTRDQGLKSVQNSYAAQGLGSSGAALKGAGQFVTGLADQTYQQQLNNYLTNYNNQFTNTLNSYNTQFGNALNANNGATTNAINISGQNFNNANTAYQNQFTNATNLLTLGSNAAAQTGTAGTQAAANTGNYLTSGAAAQAGGIVGSANATNNALTGLTSNLANSGLTLAMYKNGAFTPAAGASTNALTLNPGAFQSSLAGAA